MKILFGTDGVEWAVVQAIENAAAEATRKHVKPENCRVHVLEYEERLAVLFSNPDPSGHWRGCPPGPCRCFEVELSRDGVRVLKSHFSK